MVWDRSCWLLQTRLHKRTVLSCNVNFIISDRPMPWSNSSSSGLDRVTHSWNPILQPDCSMQCAPTVADMKDLYYVTEVSASRREERRPNTRGWIICLFVQCSHFSSLSLFTFDYWYYTLGVSIRNLVQFFALLVVSFFIIRLISLPMTYMFSKICVL